MPRLALASALVLAGVFSGGAMPAAAQDRATFGIGQTTRDPFVLRLEPRDGPAHVADLIVSNRLTHATLGSEAVLSIDGLTVTVHVVWGPGTLPDRATVIVPDGFVAVPESLDVAEDEVGTIRIFLLSAMVLG